MFTGIVEEIGIIKDVKRGINSSKLLIKAEKVLNDTEIGDSICTNGVCLTVSNKYANYFEADVMAETLRKSNLGILNSGCRVNLERALTLKSRLGGHIVSGHIDGIGYIRSLVKEDNATWITIMANEEILRYIVMKGSIAIDGISLTVAYVDTEVFKVSIIPHTSEETTLLNKNIGETVNLECDVISKYIEKLMSLEGKRENCKNNSLTEEFLRNNGFI